MDPSLSELIHSNTKSTGIPVATYKSLFGIQSKFTITANKFGDFMNGYCKLAYEDEQEDSGDGIPPKKLCIAELTENKTTLPVIGDFHFKFHVEEGEEDRSYYGEDFPLRVIKCYQKAMSELLNLSEKVSEYICCVLEGHSYRKGDMVHKHTVFHFPFCQLDIKYMKNVFRPYVEKLLRQSRVIECFDTQPVGDWKDIITEVKEFYPLYRSSINDGIPHLSLTHIYWIVEESHIEESYCPDYNLSDVFKPGNHSFIYNGRVPLESIPLECNEDEDEDEYKKYWLPLFLSIHFWTGQTIPKEVASSKDGDRHHRGPYEVDEAESDNPIRMAHALLPLLHNDRAIKDYSWLDVGRCLYNITRGSEEGLNIWIQFSSRASIPGRDKNMCIYKYRELSGSNLSVRTLAWYAKLDNENGYNEWHNSWCQKAFNEALTTYHTDVAKAIYRFFWLEYLFSSESQCWYQYRGHHYYRIGKEPIVLRKEILEKFIGVYERMRADVANTILATQEDLMKKNLETKIKDINMLISKLKNENYRTTILKSAKDSFHVEEFEKLCDKNHYLTALSNCVLEVVDKKVRPRSGKPEDYILKYSPIEYPFDYKWESFWVKEVMYWFKQITVGDNDLRHYFLKRLSSFLRGQNPEKLFDVWTNEGNGGKSMLAKTLQFIFGSYFIDFPVSLLTGGNGKNSSGPSPELAQAINARGAILSEPDDRDAMKGGMIKRITGGDRIFTRALHDNGGSMELTFKTIMVCNRIPDIANVDKALIRRFVIMPFLGTWCDDCPEKEDDQFRMRKFKIDPFFETKIPELAKGLLWIIVQYYTHYAEEGLKFPAIVEEYIKKHWEDNDWYLQFIAEKIEYAYKDGDKKEIDTDAKLNASDIYKEFKVWFREYYPGMLVPSLAQMTSDLTMSGRLGPQGAKRNWLGIKLRVIVPTLPGNEVKI
jgi:phage/plasmid-associated DNA primase